MARSCWPWLCLWSLAGCAPFALPPEGEGYACEDAGAWSQLRADCVREAGCPGIAGMAGFAEGEAFAVSGPLRSTAIWLGVSGSQLVRIDARGTGTYFDYTIVLESLGAAPGDALSLGFDFDAEHLAGSLEDDLASAIVRWAVPGRVLDREASPEDGLLHVRYRSTDAIEIAFDGWFGGEAVSGCLAILDAEIRAL